MQPPIASRAEALQIPPVRAPKLPSVVDLAQLTRLFEFRTVSRWVLLGLVVGVLAGLAASAFYVLTDLVQYWALEWLAHAPAARPAGEPHILGGDGKGRPQLAWLVFAPALGGLISGLFVYLSGVEGREQGHDGLIRAFHKPRVKLGLRVPLVRAFAAVGIIGTGGSAGREGPVAFLGAGLGALVGRTLRLSARDQRQLLLAGAAGGIAAIFRSPLGAALFVLEVLYRDDFEAEAIVPTVLSAVVGYSTFTLILGETSMFAVAARYSFSPLELPFYLLMAIAIGLSGIAFVRTLDWGKVQFARLPLRPWLRCGVGGLLVGLCALFVPDALGAGYGSLQRILLSQTTYVGWPGAALLLGLALAKVLTTTFTVGSGGSGGVFGPSLVIGGMVGGAFGAAAHAIAPGVVSSPGAFVVVGMASFLGGVACAPISTLVMACEMTRSYELLVPVMLAEVVAYSISRGTPLYRHQVLSRRNSEAHGGEYVTDVLQDLRVGDIIGPAYPARAFPPDTPLEDLMQHAAGCSHAVFPMTNTDGAVCGLLTLDSLKLLFSDPELKRFAIAADCCEPLVSVSSEDSLALALERFATSRYPQLPVIENGQDQVHGWLSYEQLLQAYSQELVRRRGQELPAP